MQLGEVQLDKCQLGYVPVWVSVSWGILTCRIQIWRESRAMWFKDTILDKNWNLRKIFEIKFSKNCHFGVLTFSPRNNECIHVF